MKKLIIYFSVIIMALTTCIVGCSKKEENLVFNTTFIETGAIELYDTVELDFAGVEQAVITSSDTAVLQVVGTSVFGKKAGSADVTVNYNGEIHKQNILVKDLGNRPVVNVSDFQLLNGESYTLTPTVTFKDKLWQGAIVTLSSSNPSIVSIEGVRATAKSLGQVTLTASVSYLGAENISTKTINCAVVSNDGIATNYTEFNVYIKDNVDGISFNKTIDVVGMVFVDGALKDDAEIEWSIEDQTIAQINDNEITALKIGSTFLTGTYIDGDRTIKTAKLPINVNIPVVEKTIDVVIDLRNANHQINPVEIFGEQLTIGGALDSKGMAITIEDNAISTANMSKGETNITLFSEDKTYGYKCNAIVAEVVIYNKQDLADMASYYDKYIALACDLDFNGEIFVRSLADTQAFIGVFNGAGHVIKNIAFKNNKNSNSLFGNITSGTIKNIALTGVEIREGNCGILAYMATGGFTVDNVYIESVIYDMWAGTLVGIAWRNPMINISNSIIRTSLDPALKDDSMIERASTIKTHSGILLGRLTGSFKMENSYFISEDFKLVGQGANSDNTNYDRANALLVHYNSDSDFINEKNKSESRIDLSGYNQNWDLSGDVPIFKSAKQ